MNILAMYGFSPRIQKNHPIFPAMDEALSGGKSGWHDWKVIQVYFKKEKYIVIRKQFIGRVEAHVAHARSAAEIDDGGEKGVALGVDALYWKGNQARVRRERRDSGTMRVPHSAR